MATAPPRKNPFDELQTRYLLLWAVVCFVGITLAIVFLFQSIGLLQPSGAFFSPVLMLLFYGCFGTWLMRYLQEHQVAFPQLWGRSPQIWRWGMLLMLAGLLLLFTLGTFLTYVGLMSWIAPPIGDGIVNSTQEGILPDKAWFAQFIKIFVVVIAAPIVEEIAFRGILLQRWERKWGVNMALIASSIAFGCLHFNPLGMTMFGLVMGLLYIRTRTLAVPVACHVLNNVFALLLEMFSSTGATSEEASQMLGGSFWLGLLMMAISTPMLWMFIQRSWPRHNTVMPYIHNGLQNSSGSVAKRRMRVRS